MRRPRRNHSTKFKSKVALGAILTKPTAILLATIAIFLIAWLIFGGRATTTTSQFTESETSLSDDNGEAADLLPDTTKLAQPSGDAPTSDSDSHNATPWRVSLSGVEIEKKLPVAPPSTSIIDLIADLNSAALAGDGPSALYLYHALEFCRDAPRTEMEYDAAELQLLTDRRVANAILLDDTTGVERLVRKKYELCQGIDDPMVSESGQYLRISANSGETEAQVLYANYLLDRASENTTAQEIDSYLAYLDSGKAKGDTDAYFWSAFYVLRGNLGSDRLHALAQLVVAESIYADLGIRENVRHIVEREYALLMPNQRSQVIAAAQDIVRSAVCCSIVYGKSWEEILSEKN